MNDQQLHDPRGRIRRVKRLMPDDANILMARLRRRDHSRCDVARCDILAGDLVVARRLPQAVHDLEITTGGCRAETLNKRLMWNCDTRGASAMNARPERRSAGSTTPETEHRRDARRSPRRRERIRKSGRRP